MASVTVALGATLNLGNFENVRIDYSLTDDVRSTESIEDAYARVEALVEAQLQQRIKDEREG